ncbi:pyrimidine 5'-nucleotidase [Sporodiniella umbellata]|nr:pyrimidine 5'-nucleotidase [Sporodiniella umbellata]
MRPVFFFDCDNCLYSKDLNIHSLMKQKIKDYFVEEVGVPEEEVVAIQKHYHETYGLSLRGLTKHHNVDPLDFDTKVDQSLPLDDLIKRDEPLIKMLRDLHCKKWVFTNAYKPHALRCLTLLGIENEFDGLTYTNYTIPEFDCKPEPESFFRAMRDAGIEDPSRCYLVDDSALNIDAAQKIGWTTIHLADDASKSSHGDYQIEDIHDLPKVLPDLWKERYHEKKLNCQSITVDAVAS